MFRTYSEIKREEISIRKRYKEIDEDVDYEYSQTEIKPKSPKVVQAKNGHSPGQRGRPKKVSEDRGDNPNTT